jgi:hypothetical protein
MRAEKQEEGVLACQIDGTKARCDVFASETVLRVGSLRRVSQSHVHTCRGSADQSIKVRNKTARVPANVRGVKGNSRCIDKW